MNYEPMSSRDAIVTISKDTEFKTRYAISKALSDNELVVSVGQLTRYLNGKRMSRKVADRVHEVFGIIINDVYEAVDIVKYYGKEL
jgi:hypothetical protein